MEVTVNGRDANQEELESSDWVTKVSKRVAELQESQQRERDGATRAASTISGCGKEGRTMPAGFNGDKHGVSGRLSYKVAGKKLAERLSFPSLHPYRHVQAVISRSIWRLVGADHNMGGVLRGLCHVGGLRHTVLHNNAFRCSPICEACTGCWRNLV
ncbi:hypothetical protein MRX96_054145 [Rhipicephalus microplus]